MTPKQREYLIEIVAQENEDVNPVEWPKSKTRKELKGYSDERLLEEYGYLLEDGELENVK